MFRSHSQKFCVFFKAVHDENRQRILELINQHKEMNASELIKKIKLSQPTVSHHLKILTQAGIINSQKQGKEVVYSVNRDSIRKCCGSFMHKFTAD